MPQEIQTDVKTSTVNTTRVVIGTMLGAVGLSAAMGLLMGYEYARNGNQIFPDEAFERYVIEEVAVEQEYRALDGLPVSEGFEKDTPIIIPIDNYPESRQYQQSIAGASVVYELLMEGPITRYFGVWEGARSRPKEPIYPMKPGPIRSLRLPVISWALPLNATIVHAGGSVDALEYLQSGELTTIDQTMGDEEYFIRDGEREAPHNLYTDSELVAYALRDYGVEYVDGQVQQWDFLHDGEEMRNTFFENAERIVVDFSTDEYRAEFEYDFEEEVYYRSIAGRPQVDYDTGEQVASKNVIIQYVDEPVTSENGVRDYLLEGEGRMQFFAQGNMFEGTWRKERVSERTQYYDLEGNEMQFMPGQTWISIATPEVGIEIE